MPENINITDQTIIAVKDAETAAAMMDKMQRLKDVRRKQPLHRRQNINYPHRIYYGPYNLRIGDCEFMIPPEFIMVSSDSPSPVINTLRQENSQKLKSGYHKRTIAVDLVFNTIDQINGFKVKGPEGYYYVDGLRSLLAQFKCMPFLPIANELINVTYGIFNVALQNITISTVHGFPGLMQAHLILQEVNLTPYLELPDYLFQDMIDWDLMRFYYQRLLTDKHEYKKLQVLPANKDHNRFKLSILNPSVFKLDELTSLDELYDINFLDIVTDKNIVVKENNGKKADSNYIKFVDSDIDNTTIVDFQCGYSNMLANIQLSQASSPSLQFMGGMDTVYQIDIETMDPGVIANIEQCQITNDMIIRDNVRLRSLGFVKLESELVEFTGSQFVMIDSVNSSTVPGFPGLYKIQLHCVAFDITQSEREDLNGFLPFDCDKEHNIDNQTCAHTEQTIYQNWNKGVERKARQDNYAEHRLRNTMEVYPDLHLPTYKEVNDFVDKCIIFRANNDLDPLPYNYYPAKPFNALIGSNNGRRTLPIAPGNYFYPDEAEQIEENEYSLFVDPDFYVFYFNPHVKDDLSAIHLDNTVHKDKITEPDIHNIGIKTNNIEMLENNVFYTDELSGDPPAIKRIVQGACEDFLGGKFSVGGTGDCNTSNLTVAGSYDTVGFISKILKQANIYIEKDLKSVKDLYNECETGQLKQYFHKVEPGSFIKRGDIVLYPQSGQTAFVIFSDSYNQCLVAQGDFGSEHGIVAGPIPGRIPVDNNTNAPKVPEEKLNIFVYRLRDEYIEPKQEKNTVKSKQPKNVLLQSQFKEICKVVEATTVGESLNSKFLLTQMIYDLLTDPNQTYGDLSNILNNSNRFINQVNNVKVSKSTEGIVKNVFLEGIKLKNTRVLETIITDPSDVTVPARYGNLKRKYENASNGIDYGSIGNRHFWGDSKPTSDIKFELAENDEYSASGLYEDLVEEDAQNKDLYEITSAHIKHFGEPTFARSSSMFYRRNIFGLDIKQGEARDNSKAVADVLNNPMRRYNGSFVDMYNYSARGTLLRAFPTFLFCILDDEAQWFDGRKLWANYYPYRSVVDIQTHAANDMPIETATVTITNSYHNLDTATIGLENYSVKYDKEYNDFQRWIYKWTGLVPAGVKITDTLMQLQQIIYKHAKLREGARVHIRMGYGADPLSLSPVINGYISDITLGDQISMVISSDGHELINSIVSGDDKDTNNGFLGLFGLFEDQESSNIIANILGERQNWAHYLCKDWFEANKYGIEHYGIYEAYDNAMQYFGDMVDKRDQYDLCKNIYLANYNKELYTAFKQAFSADEVDGEKNVVFNQGNMTPWDVFQICTQQVPEYIVKTGYHQFDSRLYFGLPTWMEKIRYDFFSIENHPEMFETCKTAAQTFYCDSITNIINNQIKVTDRFTDTNVKVMYIEGDSPKTTGLLRSDSTIDFAYQRTKLIDSAVVQDALGWDAFYSTTGIYRLGIDSANRIGNTHLIYGWQQQYQGALVLMGMPGMKPYDNLMINDTFARVTGVSFAREVMHGFNTATGYVTTVIPGMVTFSTAQDSGMVVYYQSLLSLLHSWSYMTSIRQGYINNAQEYATLIGSMLYMQEAFQDAVDSNQSLTTAWIVGSSITGIGNIICTAYTIFNAIRDTGRIMQAIQDIKNVWALFGSVEKAYKIIKFGKNIMDTIKIIANAAAFTGWGLVLTIGVHLLDILFREFFDWLAHRNMVVTLPMYWYEYPMIAGAKGGQKITLMGTNATATEETDKSYWDPKYNTGNDYYNIDKQKNSAPQSDNPDNANNIGMFD